MDSFLSLLNVLRVMPTHHSLMTGHSHFKASNTTGVDEDKKDQIVTASTFTKSGSMNCVNALQRWYS